MIEYKENFINAIRPYIEKYVAIFGYSPNVVNGIIAQACLESNFGCSELSSKYHNYFGLKCGSNWNGKRINYKTMEEYTINHYTKIYADFRGFDDMESGVKGYFDFLKYTRYQNLHNAKNSLEFIRMIKNDGFATSSNYVTNIMKICDEITNENNKPTVKSNEEIAKEVIRGLWGNGNERRVKLSASGYDYQTIQNLVNKMLA